MHHNLIIKDGNTTKVVKEVLVDGIQFVDETPRAGSTNFVTSDGVNKAIADTKESVDEDVQDLQEQIDEIAEKAGSGYIPKGEADVATLNGLSGQENGWLYTMTDSGTLTDGSLAVVAGDTVAWDEANSVWYKAMDYAPRQYGTNEVHNLATTITAFRTGDVIPVDGPSGTAKMAKDDLLRVAAENALAGNISPAFDATRGSSNPYNAGDVVEYNGVLYKFINSHYGPWNNDDAIYYSATKTISWQNKGISDPAGKYNPVNKRLSIYGELAVRRGTKITIKPSAGLVYRITFWNGKHEALYQSSSWESSDKEYIAIINGFFNVNVAKSSAMDDPLPISEASDFVVDVDESNCKFFEEVVASKDDKVSSYVSDWLFGSYDPQTLVPTTASNRFRTEIELKKGESISIFPCGNSVGMYATNSDGDIVSTINRIWVMAAGGTRIRPIEFGQIDFCATEDLTVYIVASYPTNEILRTSPDYRMCQVIRYGTEPKKETESLYIGRCVNGGISNVGWSDLDPSYHDYRVSQRCVFAIPYQGMTIQIKCPPLLDVGIREGTSTSDLATMTAWMRDGSVFTFQPNSFFYVATFSWRNDPPSGATGVRTNKTIEITADEINALVDSGELKFEYTKTETENIVSRNSGSENYIKATMLKTTSDRTKNLGLHVLPSFIHVSDIHGDALRYKSCIDYADYLGVDGILVSGDMTADSNYTGVDYSADIKSSKGIPTLMTIGNHEAKGNGTDALQYDNVVKPFDTIQNGYNLSTSKTYYYKDFDDKKIRVISLNAYEGSYSPYNNITQTQVEWFIDRLEELTDDLNGYGVIVMFHLPEKIIVKDNTYGDFYQNPVTYTETISGHGVTGTPISDIIDAFIGKTSITGSYTTQGVTATYSADFSGITNSEFLFYANGHQHNDRIGYLSSTTHKQLNLNVACAIPCYPPASFAWYGGQCDVPRGDSGVTQDLFNLYTIDRANGRIRVARIGANLSHEYRERKYMSIPYKD